MGPIVSGEILSLNGGTAIDTSALECSGGGRNVSCSGEILRYDTELRLRRQLTKL